MNPYAELDSRPNKVTPVESSSEGTATSSEEAVEGTNNSQDIVSIFAKDSKGKTSVANRDFTEDLKLYMAKYPAYKHMLGMDVPMRSYMWSFFSGIVNMALCEEVVPSDATEGFNESALDCLVHVNKMLQYACNHWDEPGNVQMAIANNMLNMALMLAWAYLKFKNYENKFVVPKEPDIVETIVDRELNKSNLQNN